MPNAPILPCAKSYFTGLLVLKVKILILQSVETQNLAPQRPHLWRLCWARNYLNIWDGKPFPFIIFPLLRGKSGPSHVNIFFKANVHSKLCLVNHATLHMCLYVRLATYLFSLEHIQLSNVTALWGERGFVWKPKVMCPVKFSLL